MKVIGGDWPANSAVALKKGFSGKITSVAIQRSAFSFDTYQMSDIRSAEVVTADNHMSVGRKIGWGVAGAVVLGPLGAAIGAVAGGNMKEQVAAIVFKDGRRALIRGNLKHLEPILAAGFNWNESTDTLPLSYQTASNQIELSLPLSARPAGYTNSAADSAPTPGLSTSVYGRKSKRRPAILIIGFAVLAGVWFLTQPSEKKPAQVGLSAAAELPSTPTLSPAQSSGAPLTGDEIRELQGLLKTAGYDPGAVDGISGPQLEGAAQRYSDSRGVAYSKGKITHELLVRLRSDRAVVPTSGGWKLNGSQGLVRIVVIDKGQEKNQAIYRAAIEDICKSMPICQVLFWVEGTGAPKSLPMSDAQTGTQMANWNQNSNTGLRELLLSCKAFPATPKEKCF